MAVRPVLAQDVDGFDCGSDAQTTWLRRLARDAHAAGTSRVYVATEPGSARVLGYDALAAASVEILDAPDRMRRGAGRHPIPVVLLSRLGVTTDSQGTGLGAELVIDALLRVDQAADIIGVRALLIHAESDTARYFYQHLAECEASPSTRSTSCCSSRTSGTRCDRGRSPHSRAGQPVTQRS